MQSDRTWGIRGSYYHIRKAIFYLLKGGHRSKVRVQGSGDTRMAFH